ncbi:MAG: hypothetical protein IJ874_09945 [Ruminococcus sp.]|nr:hypothetical protein [Ruminococcus sp.]
MKLLKKVLLSVTAALSAVTISVSSIGSYASYTEHWFTTYPCYKQYPNSYDCWAQTIRSMYKYVYNTNISIEEIISKYVLIGRVVKNNPNFNYSSTTTPGDPAVVLQTFGYFFDDDYNITVEQKLSPNEIIAQYSCNLPAFIGFGAPDMWHACALVGYRSGATSENVGRIYYMNPASGKIEKSPYLVYGDVHLYTDGDENQAMTWNITYRLI